MERARMGDGWGEACQPFRVSVFGTFFLTLSSDPGIISFNQIQLHLILRSITGPGCVRGNP